MHASTEWRGRDRVAVSACALQRNENQRNGLDLESWIAEALIDTLIPYPVLPKPDSKGSAREDEEAVGHYVEQVDGTDCQLAHNVMPSHMSPEAFRLKAKSLYAPGVENLFFWDAAGPRGHADISAAWNDLRCLGHEEENEPWRRLGEPSLAFASVPVPRVGDLDLTYQTPGWR